VITGRASKACRASPRAGAQAAVVSPSKIRLRAEYEAEVATRLQRLTTAPPLREDDLAPLPEPVQRWVRASGAIGHPRPTHVFARWRGRIRAGKDDRWMEAVAEQHNFLLEPSRFFLMKARRAGIPVVVLHAFRDGEASMRVRLLSLVPVADARGPEATRAETVTLLNDVALLAPGGLVDPAILWEPIDHRSARARYTLGANTVSAVLEVDLDGDLVDFVSDDRLVASPDGKRFTPQRWSTPVRDHRSYGPHRAPARGEGMWHPREGSFVYLELELLDLRVE
jgi:hypothetical protein